MTQAHGGNLRWASEHYGNPPGGWLDFSANINPLGVPKVLKKELHRIVEEELEHYPDPDCKHLREVLAHYHGLASKNVLCGNGASELLQLALEIWPPGPYLLPVPSFVDYEQALMRGGHQPVFFPLQAAKGFVPDLEELHKGLAQCQGLVLGNPNNPTSVLLPRSELVSILATGKHILVDEAFLELTCAGEDNSLAGYVREYPNLILVRAFTKSLAIPGLRLGYALGEENTLQLMKGRQVPWSVNRGALAVGDIFQQLKGYRDKTALWLRRELDFLWRQLNHLPGITAYQPATNFILCRYGGKVSLLQEALAQRGILIRPCENFRGLDQHYFRVAVRSRRENQRLLFTLEEVLANA